MSIVKIAELAGVSKSTVSKVMSGSSEISDKTALRVIKAAQKLGLYEKYNKAKIDKNIIAVTCPEVGSEYYNKILLYLDAKIKERGDIMSVFLTAFNGKKEAEIIGINKSPNRANAIIVIEPTVKISYSEFVPIVAINSLVDQEHADTINTDFYHAVFKAIYNFKTNGHTKIGYIGEELTQDKYNCFTKAMKEQGLELDKNNIIVSEYRFETAGYTAMEKLLKQDNPPTAIFAAYDYIAIGAIKCIKEHRKNVPQDFSIIGIDDIAFSSNNNYSLSSIRSDTQQICDLTLEILYKKIANKHFRTIQNINIKARLVERDSVSKATAP